ncbi:tRNA (5-methylaminomethyl-2-thiouridine)(34)-methyltransferase MnmD [Prochlorococcus sp. MIT 1223]|uniref:tRNA (5-methylaminomethyl-2-thiouridine)(34)-methyltransferase MnmD n=1 Tax=Prochlorococcus sp. MIT 1223 TaxID=3096217 RepID=UPI002A7474E3|nr:MnmC family methyltransferase [Prochlorococcus sp. MIT 1223]
MATNVLGELTAITTNDGSLSFKNSYYQEAYHDINGARKESMEKFIAPAEINRFLNIPTIRVLDVCVGLGYNLGCLVEEILETPISINWWGLEIDQRPMSTALKNKAFRKSWHSSVLEVLESTSDIGNWEKGRSHGKVIWGDARKTIDLIPSSDKFDLIFQDAFSPRKCPNLWTEEFLKRLAKRLAPNGRLITYSSSASIRGSLLRAGLTLRSIKPETSSKEKWSLGTTAILPSLNQEEEAQTKTLRPLTRMEKEHLKTSAGVPFRDPSGCGSVEEILKRREKEQIEADLPSTSSWKKRWNLMQSR